MKTNNRSVLRVLLIVGLIGTLLFTFTQSLLPPDDSSEMSDGVLGFLETIISPDTLVGAFVHENIRKIAHFVEYMTLGIFTSLYVVFFMPGVDSKPNERIRFVIYSFAFAPLVGLFDETLQIFSGRGPAILDVWIDTAGFFSSAAIVYAVYYFNAFLKSRKNNISKGE